MIFLHISQGMVDSLLQPITLTDVKDAFSSMNQYKAPGPDGFQPIFYQTYWDNIGGEVAEFIAQVFTTGNIPPGLTETRIVPIPMVDSPLSLKDFRPISLCKVLLKAISKILVL